MLYMNKSDVTNEARAYVFVWNVQIGHETCIDYYYDFDDNDEFEWMRNSVRLKHWPAHRLHSVSQCNEF